MIRSGIGTCEGWLGTCRLSTGKLFVEFKAERDVIKIRFRNKSKKFLLIEGILF